MTTYLFDTNHLSAALDQSSLLEERVFQRLQAGDRFGTNVLILCELQVGIDQTRERDMNNRRLSKFMARVKTWPMERILVPTYAEIYRLLKSRGRVLSQADMLLAAMARTIGATILTNDRDFEALPDIPRDNWI